MGQSPEYEVYFRKSYPTKEKKTLKDMLDLGIKERLLARINLGIFAEIAY
jgi:hypothetical protein